MGNPCEKLVVGGSLMNSSSHLMTFGSCDSFCETCVRNFVLRKTWEGRHFFKFLIVLLGIPLFKSFLEKYSSGLDRILFTCEMKSQVVLNVPEASSLHFFGEGFGNSIDKNNILDFTLYTSLSISILFSMFSHCPKMISV